MDSSRRQHSLRIALLAGALSGLLLGSASVAWAQQPHYPADHHPWARFPVNSWKLVRVTSETLDAKGQVAGITKTETRTTLVASTATSYTLRVDVTVEVAGRRFATPPQTFVHGYYGESPGQPLQVRSLGDSQLAIDNRMVACELRQATVESDGIKRVSTIHYSDRLAPYELRRETKIEGLPDDKPTTTLVEIVALDLPQRVIDELTSATYVKTTHRYPQGTKVTLEVNCEDVPGGVVSHSASETDASGKTVRRSSLELIDYEIADVKPGDSTMTRRQWRHHRKATRRMD